MNSLMHAKSAKGFTIIEFLVASVLAVIVIVAAGSTYFITRNLGHSIQQRLTVQQNLRSATTLLMRDARMAGSFGCYNTSSELQGRLAPKFDKEIKDSHNGKYKHLYLGNSNYDPKTTPDNLYGISKGPLTIEGQTYPNALSFTYGLNDSSVIKVMTDSGNLANVKTDSAQITSLTLEQQDDKNQKALDPLRQSLASGGFVVLSSCRGAYGFKATSSGRDEVSIPSNMKDTRLRGADLGELTLSQIYTVAYAIDDDHQLVRVDTNAKGEWNPPQIVATGINSMEVGFAYTDNCPSTLSTAASAATQENFSFVSNLSNTADKQKLPSLVQVRLNYDVDVDIREGTAATKPAAPKTATYIINATVRGGNTCGNRAPAK